MKFKCYRYKYNPKTGDHFDDEWFEGETPYDQNTLKRTLEEQDYRYESGKESNQELVMERPCGEIVVEFVVYEFYD